MKFTKQALTVIAILGIRNVFGAESPTKPVSKKLRSSARSMADADATATADADVDATTNLFAGLSSPKTKSVRGAVADGDNNHSSSSTTNIMTQMLHIPVAQVKLREKYRDRDDNGPLLVLCFKFYDAIEDLLKSPQTISEEGVKSLFQEFTQEFHAIYPEIINLGQDLLGKAHGVMMCFAIDECISFIKGTGFFDKMDPEEECVMYNIRHTFYSIMLDGGTNKNQFTTQVAEHVFGEHFDLWDFVPVCCMGTENNPEGNKWSVVLRQLKNDVSNCGLSSGERETFWWLLGNINSSFRALMHYAKKTGKPYSMLVTSITAMQKGYGIDTIDEPLESEYCKVYFTCHPQAAMYCLPNRNIHPPESIKKYGEHTAKFFASALTGKKYTDEEGGIYIDLMPPSVEKLYYYLRKAKIPPHSNATPEEVKAHEDAMFAMWTIPHLAAVAAKETNDYDLSHLSLPHVFSKREDKDTYNELVKRLGEEKLLIKLRRRRNNEMSNLLHLSAVVVKRYGVDQLGRVSADMFEGTDKDIFIKWSKKYDGDDKLSNKLVEARKKWDSSSLNELNELNYLAKLVANQCAAQDGDMSTFDFSSLSEDDCALAAKHSAICGGGDKLLEKLVEIRKDFEKSRLAELNHLRHLALTAAQSADANTLTSPSSLSESLFPDETDRAKFKALSDKYEEEEDMLFKLFQPHLAKYQGVCQGIPELSFDGYTLPHKACNSRFTSKNPRLLIGSKSRGHGLSGFPVCKSCLDKCLPGEEFSPYEVHVLTAKEERNSLSTEEHDRLKTIRRFKSYSELGSHGYYFNTRVVTINSSRLSGIRLGQCSLSTNTPNVLDANGCDGIQAQDRIIAINGQSTKKMTHQEAQRIINEYTSNVVVILGRLMTSTSDNRTCVYKMRDKTETTTESRAGIRVDFCSITGIPKVTGVSPDQALHNCKEGDLILSINGVDVSGIVYEDEARAKLVRLLQHGGKKEFEILKAVPL